MAKHARREPTNITLSISVDLHEHWEEREIRDEILPPYVFAALAEDLAEAVRERIHAYDVECITVGEPARRNFAHTFHPRVERRRALAARRRSA